MGWRGEEKEEYSGYAYWYSIIIISSAAAVRVDFWNKHLDAALAQLL